MMLMAPFPFVIFCDHLVLFFAVSVTVNYTNNLPCIFQTEEAVLFLKLHIRKTFLDSHGN